MTRPLALVLLLALLALAIAALVLELGRDSPGPAAAAPMPRGETGERGERAPATDGRRAVRLLPPSFPLPEPEAGAGTRRVARPTGVALALSFSEEELPQGVRLGQPSWLFPENPIVVTKREDLAELAEKVFAGAIEARDIERVVASFYEGTAELVIYAIELRAPELVARAARSFAVPSGEETHCEVVESGSTLVLVWGEERNALYWRMVELVRERLE